MIDKRRCLESVIKCCLVAADALDVPTNNQSPTRGPVLKTKTNSNEGAKRALRTSIKSHSMSLNEQ